MIEKVRRRASRFGLEVIMVNVWEHVAAREEALRFCDIWGLSGPLALDDRRYMKSLGLSGVPFNLLIDEAGVVRGAGFTTPEEIEQALPLLGLPPLSEMPDEPGGTTPGRPG